ncbi:MAG: hypothetical protein KDC92_00190 [Bacteroidetes bacterium]|nr:hypothetical protein [Bacteroidota bacterium]
MSQLPPLSKMVKPALATFTRSKQVPKQGVHAKQYFNNVYIEHEKLEAFKAYFGFEQEIPLAYLYLLAQRAQAAFMLTKSYGLPIPGTIHLNNQLKQTAVGKVHEPFDLRLTCSIAYKDVGSLHPKFLVEIYQNGQSVAECESHYLVKRKSKNKGTKREKPIPKISLAEFEETWHLPKDIGKQYAEVSNDHNPIHTSKTAAKLLGFRAPIAQGWCVVSKAINAIERSTQKNITSINVGFNEPAYLPSTIEFLLDKKEIELVTDGKLVLAGEFT